MNWRIGSKLLQFIACTGIILVGCSGGSKGTDTNQNQDPSSATSDPALLPTLQAELAQTAAWASTLTPPALSPSAPPIVLAPITTGTPLADRNGGCPSPGGYVTYDRDSFCISAPSTWNVLNVDGGMAAFLGTTPGQSISIQPDWAESTAVCHLMIFITPQHDVGEYLMYVRDQQATRTDLTVLSPIAQQSIGDIGMYGFSYADTAGVQGSIYAVLIDLNRLLRISTGGSNCPIDSLAPVMDTMRIVR